MKIATNVVKLVSKHLGKVLSVDKDTLAELLTNKGFFDGAKVDLAGLDISDENIKVSKVINQLAHVQFLHIDVNDNKIVSIQLSKRCLLKFSSMGNLVDPKGIKAHIHKITKVQAFMILSQLNVSLRELVTEYLPEGYSIQNWKPVDHPDIKQQYVIHRNNVTAAKFFKDLEIIYPIAKCFGKVIDDDINISIEDKIYIDEATCPIRQYALMIDCRGDNYLNNFEDPNFSGPILEQVKLALSDIENSEEF